MGWSIHFGPCDESSKVASAGVGVMWRDDEVQVYPEKIGDEASLMPGIWAGQANT